MESISRFIANHRILTAYHLGGLVAFALVLLSLLIMAEEQGAQDE